MKKPGSWVLSAAETNRLKCFGELYQPETGKPYWRCPLSDNCARFQTTPDPQLPWFAGPPWDWERGGCGVFIAKEDSP